MKIAVLSDIHGNYTALETVLQHVDKWKPDQVLVAGDIINRGPRSLDCLELLLEKQRKQGWILIRGNHEDYVIHKLKPDPDNKHSDLDMFVMFTARQVKAALPKIIALPERYSENIEALGELRMVHASMIHNRDGIYPETQAASLREKIAPAPDLIIVGHTHRSLVKKVDDTLVVNAGSVGLPFDGDRHAGYAQIEGQDGIWKARIVKLDYDLKKAELDFYTTGFLENAGPLAYLVLLEFQTALSQLYHWSNRYMQSILNGELSIEESADLFLKDPIHNPYW